MSGVINALLFSINPRADDIFLPGLIYGLVTGIFLMYALSGARIYSRLIFWTIFSVLGYMAAYASAITISFTNNNFSPFGEAVPYTSAGFIGASILCLAFSIIFQKMNWIQYFVVIATGTVVAAVVIFNTDTNAVDELFVSRGIFLSFLPTLYIAWQTAVTTVLGLSFLLRNNRSDERLAVEVV